jgi:hypothetical protein
MTVSGGQLYLASGRFFLETDKTDHWIPTPYSCFHVYTISRVFQAEPVRTRGVTLTLKTL